jgi:hypothetical protein
MINLQFLKSKIVNNNNIILTAAIVIIFIIFVLGFTSLNHWNADSLYMEVFHKNFLRDIRNGDRWLQMPASAYFPDQIIYALSRLFFSINFSIWLTAFSKIVILILCLRCYLKMFYKIEGSRAFLGSLLITILFVISYKSDHVSLFRIEYNHFSEVISSLLLVSLLFYTGDKSAAFKSSSAMVIGFLAGISSAASLIICGSCCVSILAVDMLYNFQKEKRIYIKPIKILIFISAVVGLVAGFIIYSQVINLNFMGDRNYQVTNISYNLMKCASQLLIGVKLLIKNPIVLSLGIFVLFAHFTSPAQSIIRKYNIMIIIGILICFFMLVILGVISSPANFYPHCYSYCIMLIANAFFSVYSSKKIPITPFIFFIIIYSFCYYYDNFKLNGEQFYHKVNVDKNVIDLTNCIAQTNKDKNNRIIIGLMDFWSANMLSILQEPEIDVMEINAGGVPRFWMQNIPTEASVRAEYYLASNKENYLLPIKPDKIIPCNSSNWTLHYYKQNSLLHDLVTNLSVNMWNNFSFPRNSKFWQGHDLNGENSEKSDGIIKSVGPGLAHFGPYVNLDEGKYKAVLLYSLLIGSNNINPVTEIGCITKDGVFAQFNSLALQPGVGRQQVISFEVSDSDRCQKGYEVRTRIREGDIMFINNLTIVSIK